MPELARTVYPGEFLSNLDSIKGLTILGPGLKRSDADPNSVLITRAGVLCFKAPNTYWVEHTQRRYIPKTGDLVVGVVTKKSGDSLRVDIGASEQASLSMLSFEGATKKQKPDVQVGDVVYGKLLSAHKEMEPELVCVDSYFKAGKLGLLSNGGFVWGCSMGLVTRLLNPENPLLATLGKKVTYEIAIGMNGKVWIHAKTTKDILKVVRCLEAATLQNDSTITELCRLHK